MILIVMRIISIEHVASHVYFKLLHDINEYPRRDIPASYLINSWSRYLVNGMIPFMIIFSRYRIPASPWYSWLVCAYGYFHTDWALTVSINRGPVPSLESSRSIHTLWVTQKLPLWSPYYDVTFNRTKVTFQICMTLIFSWSKDNDMYQTVRST